MKKKTLMKTKGEVSMNLVYLILTMLLLAFVLLYILTPFGKYLTETFPEKLRSLFGW